MPNLRASTFFFKESPEILKHDFISKAQADFLDNLKEKLIEGELIVTMDFSENHSLEVQDTIQSQHWNKIQVTLHVYDFGFS